jgi:uncharacterized membrane protein (DUF2068 family)
MECSVLIPPGRGSAPGRRPFRAGSAAGYAAFVSAVNETSAAGRPRRLTTAAVLTGLEGLVVAVFGVVSLAMLATDTPDGTVQAVTMAVTVLALSVLPLAAARGLWLRRRWSRGPSMIVQLLALPTGYQMATNGGVWVAGGVAITLAAVAVLACLVNPTATEALGIGPRDA